MPIHDWTRVDAGTFHDFHQGWTIEIRNTLNNGVLPPDYFAMADQCVTGPEPDVVTLEMLELSSPEPSLYAQKANRITVRHKLGRIVAIIEVVSSGDKDSKHAIRSFTSKAVNFVRKGINFVIIDLFSPTRDPGGILHTIWDELVGKSIDPRPLDKPLSLASYYASNDIDGYLVDVAVGDCLPEILPLFLAPGRCVSISLEKTYQSSWQVTPQPIRDLVEPPFA
jgi:hypothetical protein